MIQRRYKFNYDQLVGLELKGKGGQRTCTRSSRSAVSQYCTDERDPTWKTMGIDDVLVFSDRLTCRQVLNVMVILGFMLNYMLRVNMTIAIVSMVLPRNDSSQFGVHDPSNEPFDRRVTANVTPRGDESNATAMSSFSEPSGRVVRFPRFFFSGILRAIHSTFALCFSGRMEPAEIPLERVPSQPRVGKLLLGLHMHRTARRTARGDSRIEKSFRVQHADI